MRPESYKFVVYYAE